MKQQPKGKASAQPAAAQPMTDEKRAEILDRIAAGLMPKLRKDIAARQVSGIETTWTEDEEFYQGMDDANRHEFADVQRKPTEGGRDISTTKPTGSTLFPNITGPYVDAAAAKISDMLLPTDDRNFIVEPTPVPDILDEEEGFPSATPVAQAAGLVAAGVGPDGQPMAPAQPAPQQPLDALGAMLKKLEDIRLKAAESAERVQDQIDDYLVECSYHTELREVIHDAARIGTGVIKGPVPKKTKVQVWRKDPKSGERKLVVKLETRPVSVRVDPWNLFPADGCGNNIHRGSHLWERDYLTSKMLHELKDAPGKAKHFDSVIEEVIKEGPKRNGQATARGMKQNDTVSDDEFEIWRYYGEVTAEELEALGCQCDDQKARYPVLLTIVNDKVIKAALNPLDNGEFPFDVLPWKKRPGMPWGTGVARQARVGQRIVVAGTRNLMDNAGQSSRPHKVMTDAIERDGDPWTWRANPDSGTADITKAMMFFVQPSLQAELTAIITMGERMVELHTGLPMIILGIQGDVEETAHGRALQNNNGSMVLRRLAKNFDGGITEPHIRRYHVWIMLYSEDEALKEGSDVKVRARGSSALVERDLQNQQLPTVMQLSLQPAFGLDPELCAEEYLKSQRFDPKAFKLTDEKRAKLAKMAPPPVVPVIEAAKIREQGAAQRQQAELAHESKEAALDRQLEEALANINMQLEGASLTMQQRLALDGIKADLSDTVLKLRTQRELSALDRTAAMAAPTEPAGRAAPGKAFTQ